MVMVVSAACRRMVAEPEQSEQPVEMDRQPAILVVLVLPELGLAGRLAVVFAVALVLPEVGLAGLPAVVFVVVLGSPP